MIEIPQDSFRLYFREVRDIFKWHKIFQGDIICDKNLILEYLGHAIAQNLVWTMEHFDIFYENATSYNFNTPTEEQISYAIANAARTTIQEVGEPGIPFQVFFRPVGENQWIWMPENNCIVCDINHIMELILTGLNKGILSKLDRFDIYYKDSQELPPKVDIDSLIDAIRKEAGKV
ncbi:hypothetical protein [Sporomusa ovata]|uniref:hypothetical protein n=1 Tax=Sporomusa ovata TaxID=2378 RepID=UPI0004255EEF|nr:hypothetical protein [Sporomusa ovata]